MNLEILFYIFTALVVITFITLTSWIHIIIKHHKNLDKVCEESFEKISSDINDLQSNGANIKSYVSVLQQNNSTFNKKIDDLINKFGDLDTPPPPNWITGSFPPTIQHINIPAGSGSTITVPNPNTNQTSARLQFKTIEIAEPFSMRIGAMDITTSWYVKSLAMHEALAYIIENNIKVDPENFQSIMDEFRAWMKKPIE